MIEIVPKVWGEERHIVNNSLYCGKILVLNKGWRCSLHYHKIKTETFYILKGLVKLELRMGFDLPMEGEAIDSYILMPGDSVDIQPEALHRFTGLEDSEIIEFSTHHEDSDSFRLEDSGRAII